jgi:hypothetical protein
MIKEWIESYNPQTREELNQALREIMQEIALAGLHRSGFFEKAAFKIRYIMDRVESRKYFRGDACIRKYEHQD